MGWGRGVVAAVAALGVLALAGCTAPTSQVVPGSTVTVAYDMAFTSLNAVATPTVANRELADAVLAGFTSIDGSGNRVADPSFGSVDVLGRDPLTVRYTIADGVRWSDGVPVDAVDLLLSWAAGPAGFPATARATSASALPTISPDRKSLTVVYDRPTADYMAGFGEVLPAHVAAREALGAATPDAAKDALSAAVRAAVNGEAGDLDRIAAWWAGGFALDAGPGVLVSDGPYRIDSVRPGAEVVLVPNPRYAGARLPRFATVRIVTLGAAAALQGIEAGVVQVASLGSSDGTRLLVSQTNPVVLAGGGPGMRIVVAARSAAVGVAPPPNGLGLLWNLWAWAPGR